MITHKASTVPVFQTEDYNLFGMMKGNRPLNQNKIGRIIKEIENGNDMLPYYPIQVRVEEGQLIILDGQHRFFICRKLNKPVHYIVVMEKKSMLDIAKINSNVEKWKPEDFINCYITAGINDYKILKDYIQSYGFSLGICLSLLASGDPGSANGSIPELHEHFVNGTFKVKTLEEATAFGEMCKQFSSFKNWRGRPLLIALHRVKKANKIEFDELVAAYNRNPGMLKEQANFKDYIVNLEQIANVNKRTTHRIILV
jgi:hypothetical protein